MKEVLLVFLLPSLNLIVTKIEDLVGSGIAHLPVVKQLVSLQDTVSALPGVQSPTLLVEEAMTVWVLYGESTQADVGSTP